MMTILVSLKLAHLSSQNVLLLFLCLDNAAWLPLWHQETLTGCTLGFRAFLFHLPAVVKHFVEVINPCWQHHVVSWHQEDSGLQETQAALGPEGVHCADRLPTGKSAEWRDANDVGVGAAQALQLWRDTSSLNHTSHLSPFSLAPKLSLEYNSYHPILSSQQKDCEVVNPSHTHDLVQNCQRVTRITIKPRHSTFKFCYWMSVLQGFPLN